MCSHVFGKAMALVLSSPSAFFPSAGCGAQAEVLDIRANPGWSTLSVGFGPELPRLPDPFQSARLPFGFSVVLASADHVPLCRPLTFSVDTNGKSRYAVPDYTTKRHQIRCLPPSSVELSTPFVGSTIIIVNNSSNNNNNSNWAPIS